MLRRVALWPLFSLVAYLLFLPFPHNSDMAGTMLAGMDMARGNWRLVGWWLPSDSYATLDVPLYALLTALGDRPSLAMLHAGALIWGAVVTLALMLAPGPGGWLAVLATLAVPITFAAGPVHMLAESPMHISMVAAVLLAMLVLSLAVQSARPGRLVAVYGAVLLLAIIGDPLAAVVGGLPAMAASALCLRRGGGRRHLGIIAASLAAILGAALLVALNARFGGYQPSHVPMGITQFSRIGGDLAAVARWLAQFLGAGAPGPALSHPGRTILLVRAPLAGLFLAALCLAGAHALRGGTRQPDYIDLLLAGAVLADLAATVLTGIIVDEVSARYVTPAFVCGSILLARLCTAARPVRLYLAAVLAGSVAVDTRTVLAHPLRPALATAGLEDLALTLRAARLRLGYAPYYAASILTALCDDQVRVRALWTGTDGRLQPLPWIAKAGWYADWPPAASAPVFFVTPEHQATGEFDEAAVIRLMGTPTGRMTAGGYVIDLYRDGRK